MRVSKKQTALNNLTVITGHCGSGKTEFAVNYALRLAERGMSPVLADLDIVNPYFRSRLLKEELAGRGVKVISSNIEDEHFNDLPAISAALHSCFINPEQISVLDIGGDPEGAVVLGRFSEMLNSVNYDMWVAVNANRPGTSDLRQNVECIKAIESVGKVRASGLLNTTHMMRETGIEDILRGDRLIREISEYLGIPVIYTVIPYFLAEEIGANSGYRFSGECFSVDLLMLPSYL